MAYLLDWLGSEFSSFEELPFGPLDAAALSQFTMVRGENVIPALPERVKFADVRTVIRNAFEPNKKPAHFRDMLMAEHFADMFAALNPERAKKNMFALACSPRFREMEILNYLSLFDKKLKTQFAAMTFVYKKMFTVIAFRGTDNTSTGWREDFDMAYECPVPAQTQALKYLESVASQRGLPKQLIVCGHSKGGNLAEYASLKTSRKIQNRIEKLYNFDGPGFKEGVFSEDSCKPFSGRIDKTIPQDSYVGLLMTSCSPMRVAKSDGKGFDQHSVFTWEVDETKNDFVYLDSLPESTITRATSINVWLSQYSCEERHKLVDAIFAALKASGAKSAAEVFAGGSRGIELLLEAAKGMSAEDRDVLTRAMQSYLAILAQCTPGHISRTIKRDK